MKYYLGIDPGKHGWYTVIKDDFTIVYGPQKMPLLKLDKPEVDWLTFIDDLKKFKYAWQTKLTVVLEKSQAMPRQGVTSMFSYGKVYGGIFVALTCNGMRVHVVPAATWTKVMLQGTDKKGKDRAYEIATRMYPAWRPTNKTEQDAADSLLIAAYGPHLETNKGADNGT